VAIIGCSDGPLKPREINILFNDERVLANVFNDPILACSGQKIKAKQFKCHRQNTDFFEYVKLLLVDKPRTGELLFSCCKIFVQYRQNGRKFNKYRLLLLFMIG
jgi:hypothetical protein